MERKLEFSVPVTDGAYKQIHFEVPERWPAADRDMLEEVVGNICNSTEPKGVETLETSVGRIQIYFKQHASQARMMDIKGYSTPSLSGVLISKLANKIISEYGTYPAQEERDSEVESIFMLIEQNLIFVQDSKSSGDRKVNFENFDLLLRVISALLLTLRVEPTSEEDYSLRVSKLKHHLSLMRLNFNLSSGRPKKNSVETRFLELMRDLCDISDSSSVASKS